METKPLCYWWLYSACWLFHLQFFSWWKQRSNCTSTMFLFAIWLKMLKWSMKTCQIWLTTLKCAILRARASIKYPLLTKILVFVSKMSTVLYAQHKCTNGKKFDTLRQQDLVKIKKPKSTTLIIKNGWATWSIREVFKSLQVTETLTYLFPSVQVNKMHQKLTVVFFSWKVIPFLNSVGETHKVSSGNQEWKPKFSRLKKKWRSRVLHLLNFKEVNLNRTLMAGLVQSVNTVLATNTIHAEKRPLLGNKWWTQEILWPYASIIQKWRIYPMVKTLQHMPKLVLVA